METVSRSGGGSAEASARGPAPPVPSTRVLAVGECPCARPRGWQGHGSLVQHLKSRSLTRTFSKAILKTRAS